MYVFHKKKWKMYIEIEIIIQIKSMRTHLSGCMIFWYIYTVSQFGRKKNAFVHFVLLDQANTNETFFQNFFTKLKMM